MGSVPMPGSHNSEDSRAAGPRLVWNTQYRLESALWFSMPARMYRDRQRRRSSAHAVGVGEGKGSSSGHYQYHLHCFDIDCHANTFHRRTVLPTHSCACAPFRSPTPPSAGFKSWVPSSVVMRAVSALTVRSCPTRFCPAHPRFLGSSSFLVKIFSWVWSPLILKQSSCLDATAIRHPPTYLPASSSPLSGVLV